MEGGVRFLPPRYFSLIGLFFVSVKSLISATGNVTSAPIGDYKDYEPTPPKVYLKQNFLSRTE